MAYLCSRCNEIQEDWQNDGMCDDCKEGLTLLYSILADYTKESDLKDLIVRLYNHGFLNIGS